MKIDFLFVLVSAARIEQKTRSLEIRISLPYKFSIILIISLVKFICLSSIVIRKSRSINSCISDILCFKKNFKVSYIKRLDNIRYFNIIIRERVDFLHILQRMKIRQSLLFGFMVMIVLNIVITI